MTKIVIEKGVPMCDSRGTGVSRALRTMDVGDSFVVPQRIRGSLTKHPPRKFACRAVEGGFRVWRVA